MSIPGVGTDSPSYVAGEILVQFDPSVDPTGVDRALSVVGGQVAEYVRNPNAGGGALARVHLPQGIDVPAAAQALSPVAGVTFAEPNYILTIAATPSETSYASGQLWGMEGDGTNPANPYGSQAGEAWTAGHTGDMHVVVGVVDTGINYTHPDLYQNIFLNQREIPASAGVADVDADGLITFRDLNLGSNLGKIPDTNGNGYVDGTDVLKALSNGQDGDGNGKVDDLIGWDFVNNDNNPYDDHSHGTHVAGTIGATPNNGGVVGVNWAIQMAPLKFLDSSGSGTTADAIKALDYLTALQSSQATVSDPEARIDVAASNNSWGGGLFSQATLDAIVRTAKEDILFVAAAGNGAPVGIGQNNDITPTYPASYSTQDGAGYEAVIAVAAIDSSGAKASFSNYGASSVDLGAPGVSVYSDVPGGYGTMSGTSMATPHVTGAVALYTNAVGSEVSAAAIRQILLATVAPTSSLADNVASDGRLDIGRLLATTDTIGANVSAAITGAYDNAGLGSGKANSGATTDDTSPRIDGTLSQNDVDRTVLVYRDGAPLGLASVSGTSWTFQDQNVSAGQHSWQAAVIDRTGMSSFSQPFSLDVEPLIPNLSNLSLGNFII